MNTVVTVFGERVSKNKARKFLVNGVNGYYKIGDPTIEESGDCYYIEESDCYMRFNTRYIVYDYTKKRYVKKNSKHIKGVVSIKPLKIGFFTKDEYKNSYIVYKDRVEPLMDVSLLTSDYVHTGAFGYGAYIKCNNKSQRSSYENYTNSNYQMFNTSLYGAEGNGTFDRFVKEYENIEVAQVLEVPKVDYTFGLEFETSRGMFPEHKCMEYAVTPVKDGSIGGNEYITVPLSGEKGINYLYYLSEQLSAHTQVNQTCSLHIHLGGYPVSKKHLVALYVLADRIQNQIKDICPQYKKDNRYFSGKKGFKDHCKFYPSLGILESGVMEDGKINDKKLESAYQLIFKLINEGVENEEYNINTRKHVKHGSEKWNWNGRYYWISFIPYLFKDTKTVEFRYHSGTTNKYKTLNWLFICNAILKYAENNMETIFNKRVKIFLEDIIEYAYGANSEHTLYLIKYLQSRRANFIKDIIKDDIYGREFANDKDYSFSLKGNSMYEFKK